MRYFKVLDLHKCDFSLDLCLPEAALISAIKELKFRTFLQVIFDQGIPARLFDRIEVKSEPCNSIRRRTFSDPRRDVVKRRPGR